MSLPAAKEPPEQFSKDKLARFLHELTGKGFHAYLPFTLSMHVSLPEHITKTCEDDTKSLFALVTVSGRDIEYVRRYSQGIF